MLSVDALCVEAEDVELLVLLAEAEVLEELEELEELLELEIFLEPEESLEEELLEEAAGSVFLEDSL